MSIGSSCSVVVFMQEVPDLGLFSNVLGRVECGVGMGRVWQKYQCCRRVGYLCVSQDAGRERHE